MKVSTYFGTKDPVTSPFSRSSNLYEADPTTGEVVGAYVKETFQGDGSLSQDITANNIRQIEARDTAISQEDWKTSGDFREGVNFYPSMTAKSAKILAEATDDRQNRELIMSKATGMQKAAGFGVGFLSGVVEPKNLLSGIAAALVTGGVGAVLPSVGRLIAVNSVKAAATRGAVEGVVGAALTEPSNLESSKIVQSDYTMTDSLMNLALGSVLGAGLGAGGKALELRAEGKQAKIADAYKAERPIMVKEFDTALAQTIEGSPVEVGAVKQIDNLQVSERARQELPKIEEKIAAYEISAGKKIEPEILKPIDAPDEFGQQYYIMNGEKDVGALLAKETDGAIQIKRVSLSEDLQGKGYVSEAYEELAQKAYASGKELQSDADVSASAIRVYQSLERKGYTVEKNSAATLGSDGTLSTPDNKPAFRVTKVPPLNERQKLRVQKAEAISNSTRQADAAPMTKLQDSVSKPDKSTAYNPKDAEEIQKYIDDFGGLEDQIALEKELEFLSEEIAELREQGLLNSSELKMLERLDEIDAESSIFDNVLLSAKLCLTRG